MEKKMNKILITGGTGFIGSHTAVSLIEAGYDVVILDNLYNSSPKVVDRIETITGKRPKFYQTDILDQAGLKKVFDENYKNELVKIDIKTQFNQ